MWVNIEAKAIYEGESTLRQCYNKVFILNSMKAQLFYKDYTSATNKQLLTKAGIADIDKKLINSKDIEYLVQTLIKKKLVNFFDSFDFEE